MYALLILNEKRSLFKNAYWKYCVKLKKKKIINFIDSDKKLNSYMCIFYSYTNNYVTLNYINNH